MQVSERVGCTLRGQACFRDEAEGPGPTADLEELILDEIGF